MSFDELIFGKDFDKQIIDFNSLDNCEITDDALDKVVIRFVNECRKIFDLKSEE